MYYSTNHDYDPVSQIVLIRLYYEPVPPSELGGSSPRRRGDQALPTSDHSTGRPPLSGNHRAGRAVTDDEPPDEGYPTRTSSAAGGRRQGRPEPAAQSARSPRRRPAGQDTLGAPPVPATRIVKLSQRKFFPAELEALVAHAGFRVTERYGDFFFRPLDGTAESQVLVCELAQKRPRKRAASR